MMNVNDEVDDVQVDAVLEEDDSFSHSSRLDRQCKEPSEETSLKPSVSSRGYQYRPQIPEQPSCSSYNENQLFENFVWLMPETLKVTYIDVLIINSEDDIQDAVAFKKHLESDILINCNELRIQPRVRLLEEMFPGEPVHHLDQAMEMTQYVFLFVTKHFVDDTWSLFQGQACLIEALKEKKWCVVPVHTCSRRKMKYRLPMTLGNLRPLQYWSMDQFYTDSVKNLLETRIQNRIAMDLDLNNKQKDYFEKNKEILIAQHGHQHLLNRNKGLSNALEKKMALQEVIEFPHINEEERCVFNIEKVLEAENTTSKQTKTDSCPPRSGSDTEINQLSEAMKNVRMKPGFHTGQLSGYVSLRKDAPIQHQQIILEKSKERFHLTSNKSSNMTKRVVTGSRGHSGMFDSSNIEMIVADSEPESASMSLRTDGPLDNQQSHHTSSQALYHESINQPQLIHQSANIATSHQQMGSQSIHFPPGHQQFPQMTQQMVQDPNTGQIFVCLVPALPYTTYPTLQPQPVPPVASLHYPAQLPEQTQGASAGAQPTHLANHSFATGGHNLGFPPVRPMPSSSVNPQPLSHNSSQSYDSSSYSVVGQVSNNLDPSSQYLSNISTGVYSGLHSNASEYSRLEGSSAAQSSVGPSDSQSLPSSADNVVLNAALTRQNLNSQTPAGADNRPVEHHYHIHVHKVTNLAVGENPCIENKGNASHSDEDEEDDDSDEDSDADESAEDNHVVQGKSQNSSRELSNSQVSSTLGADVSARGEQREEEATSGFPECPEPVSSGDYTALTLEETVVKKI